MRRQLAAALDGRRRAPRRRRPRRRRCAWRFSPRSPIASRAGAKRAARRAVVLAAGGSAELGLEADGRLAGGGRRRRGSQGGTKRPVGTRPGGPAQLAHRARVGAGPLPRARRGDRSPRLRPTHRPVERTTGLALRRAGRSTRRAEPAPPDEETARLLAAAALARGIDKLPGGEAIPRAPATDRVRPRRPRPRRRFRRWAPTRVSELVRLACVGRRQLRRAGHARRRSRVSGALCAPARSAPGARHPGARAHHALGRSHGAGPLSIRRAHPGSNRGCRTSSERAPRRPSGAAACPSRFICWRPTDARSR